MKIALAIALTLLAASASAAEVRGYTRQDGTYVAPHHRTAPDSNPYNNYSTKGNVNPYTGQAGTVNPQPQSNPYEYGSRQQYQPYGR